MKRLAALLFLLLGLAPAWAGNETFPAYVHAGSASGTLTTQCIPIVDSGGTTTTKLCSGYATALGAAASNATLTLGSTTLTLGGTTTSVSGLTLPSPTFSGTVAGAGTVPNSVLVNSSTTVNGTTCTLGSSCSPAAGAFVLISTQTASSSATLQWTGLGSTYNTLLLDCNALVPATTTSWPNLQVGEGATPTWNTSNYNYAQWVFTNAVDALDGSTSTTNIPLAHQSDNVGTTFGYSFKSWISNVSSSALLKNVSNSGNYYNGTTNYGWVVGGGIFTGDTNPVTALRVQMNSGNITSGQCSLYGLTP